MDPSTKLGASQHRVRKAECVCETGAHTLGLCPVTPAQPPSPPACVGDGYALVQGAGLAGAPLWMQRHR